MAPVAIDFLLAPDGASVRRIKKVLAENAPGLYRVVGTWSELMALVEVAYLLPACPVNWASLKVYLMISSTDMDSGPSMLTINKSFCRWLAMQCAIMVLPVPEGP